MLARRQGRTQAVRRQEAEQGLLKAAIHLLVKKGYDGVTLAEVGERAGYSRGLAAHYFGKKEELLSQVANFIVTDYRDRVWNAGTEPPGLARLADRVRRYSQYLTTEPSRALTILLGEANFQPTLKRAILALNRAGTGGWEAEIQAGVDAGDIRPDVDVQAQTSIIYSFLRGQAMFLGLDPKYPRARATEEFIQTLAQRIGLPSAAIQASVGG